MRLLRLVLRCLVAAGIMTAPLCAIPILYVETGQVSGTPDLAPLAHEPLEFDFEANSADLEEAGVVLDPYSNPVTRNFAGMRMDFDAAGGPGNDRYASETLSEDTDETDAITSVQDLTLTTITSVPEAGGVVYAAVGLVMIGLCLRPLRRESLRVSHGTGPR
jgi:hypothetical protein